ncbi:MAG TPA: hypothetical protein VKV05_02115 [Terriglobales bacterium]|nr:hypothetical protein [Terriglobales bacterium]
MSDAQKPAGPHSGSSCLMCPSAQPEMPGSRVLGVVGGTPGATEVAYLNEHLPVTEDLLRLAGPVPPTQVFRFAAQCDERACAHFDGTNCKLATRIVNILPAVVDALPPCLIRATCRWYQQEGRAACMRCPQIVTLTYEPSEAMRLAAEGK